MKGIKRGFLSKLACVSILALILFALVNHFAYVPLDTSEFPLSPKWSSYLGGNIVALSSTDNGRLIFARTTGSLYALDSTSGQEVWQFPLSRQVEPSLAIAHNEIVYVADSKKIYALSQKNGSIYWSQFLPESTGQVMGVYDDYILVNNRNFDVRAYNAATGSLLWTFPAYWYHSMAFVSEDKVYIPKNGLYEIDINTGTVITKQKSDAIFDAEVDGELIYYLTSKNVVSYNVQNDLEIWRHEIVLSKYGHPRLKINDRFVIVGDMEFLTVLEKDTGQLIWKVQISEPLNPSIIGENVFVMEGYNRVVRVFRLATGNEIGDLKTSKYHFFLLESRQDMIAVNNLLILSRGKELLCFIDNNR